MTSVTVNCTSGTAYYVNMSDGTHTGSGFQNNLGSGSSRLPYTLYRESTHATKWGNSYNYDGEAGTGTGAAQTLTMYPQISAYQADTPGSYSDTVTVTVRKGDNSGTLTTSTFAVTATIVPACTVSASNLNFGTFTGAQTDATTTLSALCTNTTPYNLTVDSGLHFGSGSYNWEMLGPGGALLHYTLWRDSARTQPWGATIGTDSLAGTGGGSTQAVSMYGRIPSGQYVTPGGYTDTVVVTLTY